MSPKISYKDKKIKKRFSYIEKDHQLEKLEFALAIAQTSGESERILSLRERIAELGGNFEEPGT